MGVVFGKSPPAVRCVSFILCLSFVIVLRHAVLLDRPLQVWRSLVLILAHAMLIGLAAKYFKIGLIHDAADPVTKCSASQLDLNQERAIYSLRQLMLVLAWNWGIVGSVETSTSKHISDR